MTVSRQDLRREVRVCGVVRSTRTLTLLPSVMPVVVPAPIPPHPDFPLPQVLRPVSPCTPATVRVTPVSPTIPLPGQAKPQVPEFPDSDPTAGPSEGPPGLQDDWSSTVLLTVPDGVEVPEHGKFDGDSLVAWLTKQDKIKAGALTQEQQRKYAKEIRRAKLEEFKSYLDNDAIRLVDKRKLL